MAICRTPVIGVFLIITLFLYSCELINPEEPVPSYIRIEKVDFYDSVSNNIAIPEAHHITDAWVYIDGTLSGIYELPATFPVIASGSKRILVAPGILENGIADTRLIYPFYTLYTTDSVLNPGKITELKPVISYNSARTTFVFQGAGVEDFESGSIFDTTAASKVMLLRVNKSSDPLVFEGDYSGYVVMNDSNNIFEAETSADYLLPGSGREVYLEMNYRTDVELTVGILGDNGENVIKAPKINLYPTSGWKKIYINFAPEISAIKNARFKVYFRALHKSDLGESKIYLDNVKLLY